MNGLLVDIVKTSLSFVYGPDIEMAAKLWKVISL